MSRKEHYIQRIKYHIENSGISFTERDKEKISENKYLLQHLSLACVYLELPTTYSPAQSLCAKLNPCKLLHLSHGKKAYDQTIHYMYAIMSHSTKKNIHIETINYTLGGNSLYQKSQQVNDYINNSASVYSAYVSEELEETKYSSSTIGKKSSRYSVFQKGSQYVAPSNFVPKELVSLKRLTHHYTVNTFVFALIISVITVGILACFGLHILGAGIVLGILKSALTSCSMKLVAAKIISYVAITVAPAAIIIGFRMLASITKPRFMLSDYQQSLLSNQQERKDTGISHVRDSIRGDLSI